MNASAGGLESIAILVIDDQESFQVAVAEMIEASDDFTLFGTAADSASGTVAIMGDVVPDLALVDVRLGDESGVETAARLHAIAPEMAIVLISTMGEDELPPEADICGAIAFVSKMKLTCAALRRLWEGHRSRVAP